MPRILHGTAFLPGDESAAGLTEKRLRGGDVQRPFHGVRAVRLESDTVDGRCRAYEPRMRTSEFFSHVTAAQLYRMPLPESLENAPSLHVSTADSVGRPRVAGVTGHRMTTKVARQLVRGFVVADPISTWCSLAMSLELDDLIAVGDFIVSGRVTDYGREPPLASMEQLHKGAAEFAGRRGSQRVAEAIGKVRTRVDSRTETRLRLLLIRAGLPEPIINEETFDDNGTWLGKPDLKYLWARTVFEYEGDFHRTDKWRFRQDILRRERFENAGWRVIRVTAHDLYVDPEDFIARTRETLSRRAAELVRASGQ